MFKLILNFIFLLMSFQSLHADEYFLTLRNDKVNLRLGPSFRISYKIILQKEIFTSFSTRKI